MREIIDWRTQEMARLGVPVALNTCVEADTPMGQAWDVVIVATGGTPVAPTVRGGATVEIITPERTVSPDVGSLTAAGDFHSMAQSGTTVTVLRRLLGVTIGAQGLTNADGLFQIFRIGDAVASRNVHAAMLDAARLCRAI